MKTTVEALKDYYVEIGGTATDVENVTTIPDMIDAITAMGGGGSGLPEVTVDDNGDVLTVVDGAWGNVAPTGNTVIFKGTISSTTTPGMIELSDNKKNRDVESAINAGKNVVIFVTGVNVKLSLRFVSVDSGKTRHFACITRSIDNANEYYIYTAIYLSSELSNNMMSFDKRRIALYTDIPTT